MHTTNLRKVGGSVMLAVPPALLDILNLRVGAKVEVGVEGGCLVVAPSPHFLPVAAMMRALTGAIEDFGSVCVLATESIGASQATRWPTVEVACAHTGPKDRRGRGQRSV